MEFGKTQDMKRIVWGGGDSLMLALEIKGALFEGMRAASKIVS
jgi:hypothetical protein